MSMLRVVLAVALLAVPLAAACAKPSASRESAAGSPAAPAGPDSGHASPADTSAALARLLDVAIERRWEKLAPGDRIVRFGRTLEGSPYLERTLEAPGPEACRVTTRGFDCVTFVELCLNLARVTEAGRARPTPGDVFEAVTFTRYRGGRLDGYASRLHYTAEWIADNVAKGVLVDVTPSMEGSPCPVRVGFMSAHPELYPALVRQPALVDSMREIERRIGEVQRTCVPRERVARIEDRLETGDIVAIRTSIEGLDYSHMGLVYRDAEGVPRLLHASSARGKVFLDSSVGRYLAAGSVKNTGITVLRATGR
jgi:hypothetical protein